MPPDGQEQETVDSLAGKIKAKYPDYNQLDNHELVSKVINRYPEYQTRLATSELQNMAAKPAGSPWERLASGAMSGLKGFIPSLGGAVDLATGSAIPKAIAGAYGEYKHGRETGQGVIPSIAGAIAPGAGLDTESIRHRADQGDIAGIVGEGIPSIAATVLGGETGRFGKAAGAVKDFAGGKTELARDVAHGYLSKQAGGRVADRVFPEAAPKLSLPPTASLSTMPSATTGTGLRPPVGVGSTTSTSGMPIHFGDIPPAPKPIDPVAAAVKMRTASWIPTKMPEGALPPAPEGTTSLSTIPSARSSPDDLISRTRAIVKPGEQPSPADLKRAGDFTQAPLKRLQDLAKFDDVLAKNEINRRQRNQ